MTDIFCRLSLVWLTFFGLAACNSDSKSTKESSQSLPEIVRVQAVNYPLFYFAKRITQDDSTFQISFDVPTETDPAYWEPNDEVIGKMQQADLLLMNGATYSKWINQVSLPTNTRINTSKAFSQMYIIEKGKYTHSHGNGVVHSHDGIAMTTWLDFRNARKHAEAVLAALIKQRPDKQEKLSENTAALLSELDALDKQMISLGNQLKETPLLASHPVYQYLARRYQLNIRSVHWEANTVPDKKGLEELAEKQDGHSAKVMIWEASPNSDTKAMLDAKGIQSIIFNPCGNRPVEGDFLSVMHANLKNLKALIQ